MKAKKLFSKIALAITFLLALNANANNVTITGTVVSGSNITFNISWDNSWNASVAPANWDAVWVFIKFQDCNTRLWAHAGLSAIAGDHTAVSPLQVDTVTDGRGVFIRRSALGGGNIGATSITLKMTIPAGTYNYKVFGIEMVNVPQASFDLGDGTSASTFNSVTVNAASQSGGITAATIGGGGPSIPATFPVGYNSFYCMKYEISQLQYVEFLNSLTFAQQQSRVTSDPTSVAGTYVVYGGAYSYRNGIVIDTPGNNAAIPAVFGCDATNGVINNINDGQSVAMANLSWADLAAYLDWAALRPMTELEFEKVCRGTMPRVAGEYTWGDTTINPFYSSTVANPLQPSEIANAVVNGRCAVALGSGSTAFGPLKVGVFATATSGRSSAGAAYYGAMEMGGNLVERTVSVATASGVAFNGTLGDGTLTSIGDSNQATWPSITTAVGIGQRGGEYVSPASYVRTSDRTFAGTAVAGRNFTYGGRGVR